MSHTYDEFPDENLIELSVAGHVGREEFEAIAPRMEAFIAEHGTIRLIEIIQNFKGFDPSLLWDGLQFDRRNLKHISHCAVVSDKGSGWLGPIARLAGAALTTRIETFPIERLDEARAWIRDPDG